MPKENHDSIEQFFKKTLAHEDKTFMEQDWRNLEKMLDEQKEPVVGFFSSKGLKWAVPVIVVFLIASLVYWIDDRQAKDSSSELQTTSRIIEPSKGAKEKPRYSELSLPPIPEQSVSDNEGFDHQGDPSSSEPTRKRETTDRFSTRANRNDKIMVEDSGGQGSYPGHTNAMTLMEKEPGWMVKESVESTGYTVENNTSTQLNSGPDVIDQSNENRSIRNAQMPLPVVENDPVDSVQMTDSTLAKLDTSIVAEDDEKESSLATRWSVSALAGPEFSTTRSNQITSPGSAYGFLVSFQILPRLLIRSGWIKTNKKYEGRGSDYQPPEGYWQYKTNGVVPNEIYGSCSVNELPIVLQYDLLKQPGSKVYLSGGVANYRMTSESYSYTFYEENPGAASGWSSDVPSSYRFAVGHFSIGYERMISNRFSLAAEPFLKAPFGGIGWTKVSLYTTGVYFSGRYTFHRKSKMLKK